jgi:4-amino-4-deoxy-L-arabinose transferase-like glycosyltransferase
MDKKTFHKKWYFKLIQVVFLCLFLFFIILGIWGIFYEDDMPLVAFFYAGIAAVAYWFIKRISHHVMFGDRIFGKKDKKK